MKDYPDYSGYTEGDLDFYVKSIVDKMLEAFTEQKDAITYTIKNALINNDSKPHTWEFRKILNDSCMFDSDVDIYEFNNISAKLVISTHTLPVRGKVQ